MLAGRLATDVIPAFEQQQAAQQRGPGPHPAPEGKQLGPHPASSECPAGQISAHQCSPAKRQQTIEARFQRTLSCLIEWLSQHKLSIVLYVSTWGRTATSYSSNIHVCPARNTFTAYCSAASRPDTAQQSKQGLCFTVASADIWEGLLQQQQQALFWHLLNPFGQDCFGVVEHAHMCVQPAKHTRSFATSAETVAYAGV